MTGAVYNKSYKATKNTLGAPLLRRFGRRDAQGEINAAKEQKSKKYQGVYYRELEGGDRSYFLRVRLGGGTRRNPIGKKSEGVTESFCNAEKVRIVNEHRFGGETAARLARKGEPIPNIKPNIKTDLETRIAELKVRIGG